MTRAVSLSSAAAVRTPSFSRLRVALLLDTLAHARWLVFTPLAKQQGSDLWRPRPSLGGASDFVPFFSVARSSVQVQRFGTPTVPAENRIASPQ